MSLPPLPSLMQENLDAGTARQRRDASGRFLGACALVFMIYICATLYFQNDALDDQWITFHYARNLVRGVGFRWNVGERPVEGYTCFLWVIVNALGIRCHLQPLLWSQCSSFVAGAVAIGTAMSPWNVLVESRLWRVVLGFSLATCPLATFMAQSGMETQLSVTLVFVSILVWSRAELTGHSWLYLLVSLLATAACLTRPENAIFLLLLPLCTWLNQHRSFHIGLRISSLRSPLAMLLGPALLIGIPYMIWRVSYFHFILPNTYYAKYSREGFHNLVAGVVYTATVLDYYAAVPLVISVSVLLSHSGQKIKLGGQLLAICGIFSIYITYAGGDDLGAFPAGRLLLPVIFILILVAASSLDAFCEERPSKKTMWIAALTAGFLAFQQIPMDKTLGREANPGLNYHASSVRKAVIDGILGKIRHPGKVEASPVSQWILANTGADDLIAIGGAGRVPYYTDRRTIDMNGLNDTHIAHTSTEERGIVTKGDAKYVIARRPKVIFLNADGGCPANNTPNSNCLWRQADKQLLQLLGRSSEYHFAGTFPWPGGSNEWCFLRNN